MIHLGYRLSGEWNADHPEASLASMDELSLRYSFYLGDVEFRVDEATFDATWGWVPILDFAAALVWVLRSLPGSGEETFNFTESEDEIRFRMKGPTIEISSTYGESIAVTSYGAMLKAAEAFAASVLSDVETAYPILLSNSAYLSIKQNALNR